MLPFWQFQRSPTTRNNDDHGSPEDATEKDEHAKEIASELQKLQSPSTSDETLVAGKERAISQTGEGNAVDEITQELRRQYSDLLRSREETTNVRLECQEALQQSNALRRWFRESQRQLRDYIEEKALGNDFDQASFLELCNTAIADSNAADAQATTANALLGKLSSLEYRVRDHEATFVQQLDRFLKHSGVWQGALLGQASAVLPHTPSPNLNPLLESFYVKKEKVGLIEEEIADLDVAYQQALTLRALRSDQDSPPDEPESHYEREYKASRVDLERKLSDAITASEDAKSQCLLADLDPEAFLPEASLDEFVLSGPLTLPEFREPPESLDQAEAATTPVSPAATGEQKQAMLLDWASKIPEIDQQTPVPLDIEEFMDGEAPVRRVTKDEVEVMHRFELDKWGYQHVQRPRRHSSVSHLRWKGNESHKTLTISDDPK